MKNEILDWSGSNNTRFTVDSASILNLRGEERKYSQWTELQAVHLIGITPGEKLQGMVLYQVTSNG